MKNNDIPWEWAGFAALAMSFYALEMYAVKSRRIRPFSHMVKRMQVNDPSKYMLMGAWAGFCGWTIKHFFFEE